jgi:hypothetical protein
MKTGKMEIGRYKNFVSTQPGFKILYTESPKNAKNTGKEGFPLVTIFIIEKMKFRCFGVFR